MRSDRHDRFGLIVGDVEHGEVERGLQPFELLAHFLAELGVEVAERLVEQQEPRFLDQRARHGEALLLAARELGRIPLREAAELDHVERPAHPVPDLGARLPADPQGKSDIVEHVHMRPDGVGLEDHADAAPVGRNGGAGPGVEQLRPVERDDTGARPLEPGDASQRRRLAAARRAEQREGLAGGDRERHVVDGGHAAIGGLEALVQAGDFQHFNCSASRTAPAPGKPAGRSAAPHPIP